MRRRDGSVLLSVLLVAAATAACDQPAAAPQVIPVPTHNNEICLMARIGGKLVVDGRWGFAIEDLLGGRYKPVWPAGFLAVMDEGRLTLVDGSGRVVARAGDTFESAGGLIGRNGDPDNTTMICGEIKVIAHG